MAMDRSFAIKGKGKWNGYSSGAIRLRDFYNYSGGREIGLFSPCRLCLFVPEGARDGLQARSQETKVMDSAGLGMLLQMKAHAEQNRSTVTLHNLSDETRRVFRVSNFHKLFAIES